MTDFSRLGAKTPTPIAVSNAHLATFSSKKEAQARFDGKNTDGQDDVLLKDRNNNNYYVLSGDKIDFTSVGVGNKVKLDNAEAEVVALEQEKPTAMGSANAVSRVISGWFGFGGSQKALTMTNPEVRAITSKAERKGLPSRMANDRRDNLLVQDANSKNQYLMSADAIDFTSVGVGDQVKFGAAVGKVTQIDDERSRR